jgi:two-component system sensor histidine kinase HydH
VANEVRRHWDWIGLAAGVAMGLADYGVFVVMGSPDLSPPNPAVFALALALIFGALGFAVGRLAIQRQRARRDADTIARQLRQLEDAQRALVQQEKLAAIGRLAAGVAHEVRNPLGVIRASAAMVREGFAPGDDAYRACQFICDESDRLNGLVTTLLDFSRPTQPRIEAVDVERVLDHALELAGDSIRARDAKVEREIAPATGAVRADARLLAQVLLDLLINAAEAVEVGGRIAVRVASEAAALRIDVADDGPGVAPAQRTSIFEPFVTTKPRGTGLGLAMAQRIAEAHGGTLAFVDGAGAGAGGAGACFRLVVPARTEVTA